MFILGDLALMFSRTSTGFSSDIPPGTGIDDPVDLVVAPVWSLVFRED